MAKDSVSCRGNISLRDVRVEFSVDDRILKVFDGFNLEIDPGQFTILIGKSGCGKTTILRMLAGLLKPTLGQVIMPEGLNIGMVFQEPRLMPWLTVEKNVTMGLKNCSAEKILDMVGLAGFEKAYPAQLSGGMAQRAALARTLIRKPDLILMDEPFAALDAMTRKTMQEELLRIRSETGAGVVFVTHDINEATLLGDRIVTI